MDTLELTNCEIVKLENGALEIRQPNHMIDIPLIDTEKLMRFLVTG